MTRASRTLTALSAAVLAVTLAAPAAATDVEVDGTGIVYAGYAPDTDLPAADIAALNAALGAAPKRVGLVGTTFDVAPTTPGDTVARLDDIWLSGATPVINLLVGSSSSASIAAGTPNPFLQAWAADLKLWLDSGGGRSAVIAPLPEMNAGGGRAYQCQSASFPAAFATVVAVVDAALDTSAEKVRWAFAPSASPGAGCGAVGLYYPGPAVVDFTAVVGRTANPAAVSPFQLFASTLADLKAVAPTKPILVLDSGACSAAARGPWIDSFFSLLRNDGHVLGFVWLNEVAGCDYRIWDGATVDGAFDTAFDGSTLLNHPVSEWFAAGTTLVVQALADTPDPCPDGATCDSVSVISGAGPTFNNYLRARLFAPRNFFIYGNPGDFPLMGDWDCNGVDTPGMYRQSDGFVYLRNSNSVGNADVQFFLGNPGDVPIAGDWNGDGCDTISVYRPSVQRFYIDEVYEGEAGSIGNFDFLFGNPGDKPFSGDFDGDGIDEVGLHRESTGFVYYRNTLTTGIADAEFFFGDPGDIIEAGDWNGDGTDTVAVYRPSNGVVYLKLANRQGIADVSFFVGIGMVGLGTAPRTA